MTHTPTKIDRQALFREIRELDPKVQAAIAMDCIIEEFSLHPTHIDLNYTRLFRHGDDRLVEMFEEDLLNLTSEQRQWLGKELLAHLWP